MAIKLMSQEWNPCTEGYKREYICDSDSDFDNLPQSACGSFAVSISSGAVRAVNTNGEWTAFAEG